MTTSTRGCIRITTDVETEQDLQLEAVISRIQDKDCEANDTLDECDKGGRRPWIYCKMRSVF